MHSFKQCKTPLNFLPFFNFKTDTGLQELKWSQLFSFFFLDLDYLISEHRQILVTVDQIFRALMHNSLSQYEPNKFW